MKCPKCNRKQNPNDTCIECGIVFSKYIEIQNRDNDKQPQTIQSGNDPSDQIPKKSFLFLNRLTTIWTLPWQSVSTAAMLSLSAGFATMFYLLATKSILGTDSTILHFTHDVNLIFHEAGHVIFGIFGNQTLAIFGGSLNQVLIPFIVSCSFWGRRDTVGFSFGLFWFFENFLDVAVYMADARALELPLIGGLGEEAHDWRNLFSRFGLIDQDVAIAGITQFIGWIGIISTWTWFIWRWLLDRNLSIK